MIYQLIKRDLLIYWRRPRELVTLLLMPFILITILGSALGAINDNESVDLDIKLAVIQHDDPKTAEKLMTREINSSSLSEEGKQEALKGLSRFNPTEILFNEVLSNKEIKKMIDVEFIEESGLSEEKVKDYSGILEMPKDFTMNFYKYTFFKQGDAPKMELKVNEAKAMEANVLKDLMTNFQRQMILSSAAHTAGVDPNKLQQEAQKEIGQIKSVSKKGTINSVSYYAIGMSVMFMFYVAANTGTLAYSQKESQIFSRILLANVPVSVNFLGMFCSTFLVAFLQMNILFGLSAIFHHVKWPSVLNYFVITAILCVMVSAFALVISAITYRANSESASRVFSSFFVPIIAFIGGSFFPVSQLGESFEKVSNYSPGGAGISAYFNIMQGYGLSHISGQIISLIITSIVLILCAMLIQPKRGESQ